MESIAKGITDVSNIRYNSEPFDRWGPSCKSMSPAPNTQQIWLTIKVPDDDAIQTAIERSGILKMSPHIDLSTQKVGIFGKIAKLETLLRLGDRFEVYRPITCDRQTVPRRDGESDNE